MTLFLVVGIGAGVVGLVALIRIRKMKSWGNHNECDEIDVRGKTILITGASSGLGKETAYEMLKRGAVVIIPCRTMDKALTTIAELKKRPHTSNGNMVPMEMDMTSLESVRNFAKAFTEKFNHIDILINNAGVFTKYDKEKVTKDGFEYNFGVNYLSHFLLTNLLLDHCKTAAQSNESSRIVNVSSSLHESGKLRLEDLSLQSLSHEESKSERPYHNSKLMQVYFSQELTKRLSGSGVHTYSLCPGWVYTSLARDVGLKWYHYLGIIPFAAVLMRTPSQGCQTILHCSLSKQCGTETGKLYRNCSIWRSSVMPLSDKTSQALWEKSCQKVGI